MTEQEQVVETVLGVDLLSGQDTSAEHVTMPMSEYIQMSEDAVVARDTELVLRDQLQAATDTVEALRIQRDRDSLATVFGVRDKRTGSKCTIDLQELIDTRSF